MSWIMSCIWSLLCLCSLSTGQRGFDNCDDSWSSPCDSSKRLSQVASDLSCRVARCNDDILHSVGSLSIHVH
ncbi:hypothetical protein F5B22DRAFT_596040, partial [Xylaria bambusicola]|uniref:uncharacterized protein n=1 Tax=Xylaria bambusicola TaxID=326684 RepID=UPI0020077357